MARWPDTTSEQAHDVIRREWQAGTASHVIAQRLGRTWHAIEVVRVAAKLGVRRPWTMRPYERRYRP